MVNLPAGVSVPNWWIHAIAAALGVFAGLAIFLAWMARPFDYLGDDATACVNCHIMTSYYQAWQASSHRAWASCNDCHLPQSGVVEKYIFKATDGLYHAAVFTLSQADQVIRPRPSTDRVILENCLRCHTPLVTEFTRMNARYEDMLSGKAQACWDCHRQVPHTRVSNQGSVTPTGAAHPDSPVPDWLKGML
jgi:cytochrome c nitrite reductase small subunit